MNSTTEKAIYEASAEAAMLIETRLKYAVGHSSDHEQLALALRIKDVIEEFIDATGMEVSS